MKTDCTFELFLNGAWHAVSSMALLESADKGWQSAVYLGYAVDHAVQHAGQRDASALSWTFPVSLTPLRSATWPGFVMDLLPQGYGRQELLRQLDLPERAEISADWNLLLAGAANPIGQRYAQESLYSLCQCSGFGATLSHNTACKVLASAVTNPLTEMIEYLKRDIANVVLGNKDNHGRNTAIQRRENGWVGLTPLFDFAPMVLHPDGIARRMRWEQDDQGVPNWSSALRQAASATQLPLEALQAGLKPMREKLVVLPELMQQSGVPANLLDRFAPLCRDVARQLEACC